MDADTRRENLKDKKTLYVLTPNKGFALLGVHPPLSAVKKIENKLNRR